MSRLACRNKVNDWWFCSKLETCMSMVKQGTTSCIKISTLPLWLLSLWQVECISKNAHCKAAAKAQPTNH